MVKLSELDKKDREVLAELDRDCRQSNAEIARKLRLGKHVVSYRIAQLERGGAIKNYYATIDLSKIGYQSYRVYLRISPSKSENYKALLDYLIRSEYVWWVGKMDGNWDLGIVVWAKSHYEFEDFWGRFQEKFQHLIDRINVSAYLRFRSYSLGFLSDAARKEFVIGAGGEVKIDENDMKLLKAMASSARSGTVELAEQTGLTPIQVSYRLKKLVKEGVITGLRANVSLEDLTVYKVNFRLNSIAKKKAMLEFAKGNKWTIYNDESIGFADFEWELLCPSYLELKKSVEEFERAFLGQIKSHDFVIYGELLKVKYF